MVPVAPDALQQPRPEVRLGQIPPRKVLVPRGLGLAPNVDALLKRKGGAPVQLEGVDGVCGDLLFGLPLRDDTEPLKGQEILGLVTQLLQVRVFRVLIDLGRPKRRAKEAIMTLERCSRRESDSDESATR